MSPPMWNQESVKVVLEGSVPCLPFDIEEFNKENSKIFFQYFFTGFRILFIRNVIKILKVVLLLRGLSYGSKRKSM